MFSSATALPDELFEHPEGECIVRGYFAFVALFLVLPHLLAFLPAR